MTELIEFEDLEEKEKEDGTVTDLTDDDVTTTFDGESVHLEDIVDENIVVYNFETRPSSFTSGDFFVIQIGLKGERQALITGSTVLAKDLYQNEDKMPYRCRIVPVRAQRSGMTYYTMAKPRQD